MAATLRQELKERLLNNEFNCEKELTLSIISGKWKIVIIWHLAHDGALRFNELHRLFKKISNRMLTKQLRELEQDEIVQRKIYPEMPPHVEYLLTEHGWTIVPIVDAMYEWGCNNIRHYYEKTNAEAASEKSKK